MGINWQAKLDALQGLDVVGPEDVPTLPAPDSDAQAASILGIPLSLVRQTGSSNRSSPDAKTAAEVAQAKMRKAFRIAILAWHPDVLMRRLTPHLSAAPQAYEKVYALVTANSIRVLQAAERLRAT